MLSFLAGKCLHKQQKISLISILGILNACLVLSFQSSSLSPASKMRRCGPPSKSALRSSVEFSREKGQVFGLLWSKKQILNPIDASDRIVSLDEEDNESNIDIDQELRSSINEIYLDFVDFENNRVDYDGVRKSDQFKKFLRNARKLVHINLEQMETNNKKAFLLNVYNALAIHSNIVLGEPSNLLGRLKGYATASYQIGEYIFSLNDIENGILRGNRAGATPFAKPQFRQGDPRAALSIPCDPRIHFCLNCGAISCPPIRFYTGADLDNEMDVATRGYLKQIEVDAASGQVRLPKLLGYYEKDFGADKEKVLSWTLQYLSEDKQKMISEAEGNNLKISYLSYNWGSNKR